MTKSTRSAEGHRQKLLEKLRLFEDAAKRIHPETKAAEMPEKIAQFREAAEGLRSHLSQHLSSKETVDWPELPDSEPDISALAGEMKTEHENLLSELAQLIRAADEMEKTLDRVDAAAQLRSRSRTLALRIARHAGEEDSALGSHA